MASARWAFQDEDGKSSVICGVEDERLKRHDLKAVERLTMKLRSKPVKAVELVVEHTVSVITRTGRGTRPDMNATCMPSAAGSAPGC
jgi:hypothetical protein